MPITINSPFANENDLCASSFQPSGSVTDSGTLTAQLSGGTSVSANQVTVDGTTWTAQFPAFGVPAGACTLSVFLNDVLAAQVGGLQFQNC
jgi:hypothetical protein